jgi:geranylgeranyl diphosphate synthase, type I
VVSAAEVSDPVRPPDLRADSRVTFDPRSPLSATFRGAVAECLDSFVAQQAHVLAAMGPELGPMQSMAQQLLVGGKRLRPAFCYWSYVAAGGEGDDQGQVLTAAASLELLHVSALVHDDVMDASDVRRGRPAAHRQFEALHANAAWLGDPASFGRAGAILLGDLLIMWSAQMMSGCGLPHAAVRRALPLLELMRTEVTCGQYLDMVAQAHPLEVAQAGEDAAGSPIELALDNASRVVEFKSARYTVQRPSQIGAALGAAGGELLAALAAYGSVLGRAFQFRDDLLGVFGDPQVTGKPAGDDLREGKRTVLIAHALHAARPAGRGTLERLLGDPGLDEDGVRRLQDIIVTSGARDAVEAMIGDGYSRALEALEATDMTAEGRIALTALADLAVRRDA